MQRNQEDDEPKTRSSSRRSSASLSRRGSVRENVKKSPLNTATSSANTTPKKVVKPQNFEFVVTGKQILRRCDRANSLPGTCRRASVDSPKVKRTVDSPKKVAHVSQTSKSQETSLEDDMSLDLSQVSDFEDTNSKYGVKQKFRALATSTPKKPWQKTRSCSLQSAMQTQKVEVKRQQKSLENTARSKESRTSSSSPYRCGTELDYSSVSPEYSGQSSADLSPRAYRQTSTIATPASQDMQLSSCCISTWQDCSEADTKVDRGEGEWTHFWANYNNSISKMPMKCYYDQCPTPYRTDTIDFGDLDLSTEGSRMRSPDNLKNVNNIIRNEGLHLTPRETQNMIKCAHILGNVLSKAIERRSREKDENLQELNAEPEREIKKKTMTLDLRETNIPLEVKEEKRSETVTTQTDISLPNTKSAPKIFENILRQLSKSSLDIPKKNEVTEKEKEDNVESEVKNEN
ncbi:uncharacterized protein LOC115453637 [Manduca sexta]|uniref:uncharacterized protein LOC115453637 n=1 Tax=Manduca sexta TaxID=7130 RepID=UPI00188EB0B5|nr:uncharacterized protein LOC115453637 [Manduca sexta]